MESRDSEGVPFASLESLLPQCRNMSWPLTIDLTAFGRHRPVNGAERWSRDHHENWKFAYIIRSLIPKILFFSIYDEKITKLSRKTVSEQWRHQALVNAWPSWISSSIHHSSFSFPCIFRYTIPKEIPWLGSLNTRGGWKKNNIFGQYLAISWKRYKLNP